jgi:pimeloyl-ACP methyl ester carboxylesterase
MLLAHATGFCAEVFGPLARSLGDRYHCWGLDLRGHGQSDRPGDGNFAWSGFATDVLAVIDHLGLRQPTAFGHSCGGAAVLLAEEARPGTFSALYCYEPVIFPEPANGIGAFAAASDPLSIGARRRRDTFPSAEDAFLNFTAKPPFADLDPEALRCYVEAGFELVPADEGGDGRFIRLLCKRDDEAEVYSQATSNGAFGHLHEIDCTVTLACGERTDAFGPSFLNADAAELRRATVEVVPGLGHFGPLQQPALVAASVVRAFDTVDDTPPS